jgi:hypothetical protein
MSVRLGKHGTILATMSVEKLTAAISSARKKNVAKINRELAKRV